MIACSCICSIVFIDEIDKIVDGGGGRLVGGGVSSEGVQRDLLPIIEGGCAPPLFIALRGVAGRPLLSLRPCAAPQAQRCRPSMAT